MSTWDDEVERLEREGEAFAAFVTDTIERIVGLRSTAVRRVLDIGSGPGVGTCQLAQGFGGADVVAVDGSPAMLERVATRAAALGLGERVRTHVAELPAGLDGLEPVDVIWAGMSLHHVGDEVALLRALRTQLREDGLLAVAERADPLVIETDDPALGARLRQAEDQWFAGMRAELSGHHHAEAGLVSMLTTAGFEVLDHRYANSTLGPSPATRQVALEHLRRSAEHVGDQLDADGRAALAELVDADHPRSVVRRPDLSVTASREIAIARRAERTTCR